MYWSRSSSSRKRVIGSSLNINPWAHEFAEEFDDRDDAIKNFDKFLNVSAIKVEKPL